MCPGLIVCDGSLLLVSVSCPRWLGSGWATARGRNFTTCGSHNNYWLSLTPPQLGQCHQHRGRASDWNKQVYSVFPKLIWALFTSAGHVTTLARRGLTLSARWKCCQIWTGRKIMENITFYILLVSIFQGKIVFKWKRIIQNKSYHVSVGYSDSLRCYGGKGGGKFQECHQDDGYKTCFTKYENGKYIDCTITNIYSQHLQECGWRGGVRPSGPCCTWSARRTRVRTCWRSSATARMTSATPPSPPAWTGPGQ